MSTISLSLDEVYDLAKKTLLFNDCDEETVMLIYTLVEGCYNCLEDSTLDCADVFEDDKLPKNTKSIAIKVILQPKEKTFTDPEIEAISNNIIDLISKTFEGKLRQ